MFEQINKIITVIDEAVWGLPLICLIMATGIFLTVRLGLLQIRHLGKAFKFMVKNEEDGEGEDRVAGRGVGARAHGSVQPGGRGEGAGWCRVEWDVRSDAVCARHTGDSGS